MSFLSRFRKKPEVEASDEVPEFTFKRRIIEFWNWYESVSDRFLETIDNRQASILADEVSARVNYLFPGMAWEFGPPPDDKTGHSFTLSGEGILTHQLLALEVISHAPELNGWTFYASRQPSGAPGHIEIGDRLFRPEEFWVTPEIDEEYKCVDITVWHPLSGQISDNLRSTALFLTLDGILGEFGTVQWIGEITYGDHKLAHSMPILELKNFVLNARKKNGWKEEIPGQAWSLYKSNEQTSRPRGDTIAGTALCWKPLKEFLDDPSNFEDPFEKGGAAWVYLSFETSFLPAEDYVLAREEIMDEVEEALVKERSGKALGGAIGRQHTYIDFLIFDGSDSAKIIRSVATRLGIPNIQLNYLSSSRKLAGTHK